MAGGGSGNCVACGYQLDLVNICGERDVLGYFVGVFFWCMKLRVG